MFFELKKAEGGGISYFTAGNAAQSKQSVFLASVWFNNSMGDWK